MNNRWDETWQRLLNWTNGHGPSERLAAQILISEGFRSVDPSHPLGGPDGGSDALCIKDGKSWAMAVYFPRRHQSFRSIQKKFAHDLGGARQSGADGMVFVTNQELTLHQRKLLRERAAKTPIDLFHLERLTATLDSPKMSGVRKQFLGIEAEAASLSLGGQGGAAPGAGGGGGGAVGAGARGGDGGPGGNIDLAGRPGSAPGAGGGGGGAEGDGATGGQGGGGGEIVRGVIDLGALRKASGTSELRFNVKIGEGGQSGGDGGDTSLEVVDADGNVLHRVEAKGGVAGKPGFPQDSSEITDLDIQLGWRVSSLILSDGVFVRDGMLCLLAAGYERLLTTVQPFAISCFLTCILDFPGVVPTKRSFVVKLVDPTGRSVEQHPFVVAGEGGRVVARSWAIFAFCLTGDRLGVWNFEIYSGGRMLARLPVEVTESVPGMS